MQTFNPYILYTQQQLYRFYNNQYLQYIILFLCIVIPFTLGRIFHDKKLTHLLGLVNNQQNTRKQLSNDLNTCTNSMKLIKDKKFYAIIATIIVFILVIVQIYMTKFKLMLKVNLAIIAVIFFGWTSAILRYKYLNWKKTKLQQKLKTTTITTQQQVKSILQQLGQDIQQSLKSRFQRQIQLQRIKQQKQQCSLYKCVHQKNTLKQLITIYKQIISQMQKFIWCDICSQEKNINVTELKINDIENNIKNCLKDGNIDRKQSVNRILNQWNKLSFKLPFICKKGCCIKFRCQLQQIKNKYYNTIKAISAKLH